MVDTAETLGAELRRSRPKVSGDGFPPELRERVGRWVSIQEASGIKLAVLAQQLGISTTTARSWARAAGSGTPPGSGQFLPVVLRPAEASEAQCVGPTLHTPQGYRVNGLDLNELIAVLRGLE